MSDCKDQTVIITFKNVSSYREYKQRVESSGGIIKNDLGETLLGFTAVMRPAIVELLFSGNLVGSDSGIHSIEFDRQVTIQ